MLSIYIDDSGSVNLSDKSKFGLFACVVIPNDKFLISQKFIEDLKNDILGNMVSKVNLGLGKSSFNENQKKAVKDILKAYINQDFELHMGDIWQGKEKFRFLNLPQKKKIIEDTFKFIKDNAIKVIIIKVDKEKVRKEALIINKQDFIDQYTCKYLLNECEQHAISMNDKGIFIIDEGNELIESKFVDHVLNHDGNILSPHITLCSSYKFNLVQMADIVAYTTNLYLNGKLDDLAGLYSDTLENIKFCDIYDEFYKNEEAVSIEENSIGVSEKDITIQPSK